MRKITACILALLLLLSVTACKPDITHPHTHTYETTLSYDDTHHKIR